jgi:hypothetical protein
MNLFCYYIVWIAALSELFTQAVILAPLLLLAVVEASQSNLFCFVGKVFTEVELQFH